VRVKQGERVLFHVLNGSATEIRSLALPGHSFKVVALDGNAVPAVAESAGVFTGTASNSPKLRGRPFPG
jgi:FtsP/CotA-like multicopper oxidase with cupredoxin domain